MKPIGRLAAAGAVALVLSACSGGGGSTPAGFVVPPASFSPIDPAARAAAQGALLAEQAATLFITANGGPRILSRRRASSARAPRDTACNGGYSEKDTPNGFAGHRVVSLYFDAACTSLRQTATVDDTFGIDAGTTAGTIVSYDSKGSVTVSQAFDGSYLAPYGRTRTWTDSIPSATPSVAATPLGRATLFCGFGNAVQQCSLAAVTDGLPFETGITLNAPGLQTSPLSGSPSTTVAFTGSYSVGAVGSMTITQQPSQPPAISGGSNAGSFTGSLTIVPGTDGPAAFSLVLDTASRDGSASLHAIATYANGSTTIALSGGTSVVVNLNGDGTIAYANGTTGKVLDYRIAS
jgi:hypothetical protein